MVLYFSVPYAGHVLEGEGLGCSGIPADDRRYTNERFIQAFAIYPGLEHPPRFSHGR